MISHVSAAIASDATLGDGAQVMAGAVIQPAARIGRNVLVNTRAVVEHDCVVGDHAHVAPGAVLCGGVSIGESAHIGAGAVILGASAWERGLSLPRAPWSQRMSGPAPSPAATGLVRDERNIRCQ